MTFRVIASGILATCLAVVPAADEHINTDLNSRIREEGMQHSQLMRTLHFLTDVYGPRLTGSPSLKAAGEWSVKTMESWGMKNAHLESWDFGHPGWTNDIAWGAITSPVQDSLVLEALAWTPGTKGIVHATAVNIAVPDQPTADELTSYLSTVKDQVRGAIVLVGKPRAVPVNLTPPAKRTADDDVKARYDPNNPSAGQRGRGGRGQQTPRPGALPARELARLLDKFLIDNGAQVRVNDAGREHGQIVAFNNASYDPATALPTVVLRNEDYGRIARILEDGTPVELEFNIANRTYPEGRTAYNTIGEIPGTEKKDEVVMLGGHLDSWHSATGATDNAIGCSIMMEAARILLKLGVHPRRTIRVALWSGEEEGLLGSQAYVKEHFGSFEDPKPGYEKFGGYFNIDSGTGRVRGATVFGPPEGATIMRKILEPFKDDGVAGAAASRGRNLGGSDNTSFSNAGLPGIGMGQDPIEYGTNTWHTNLDTYERILEDDVKKDAVTVAWSVYQLAMRDELLPRFTKDKMPPRPAVEAPATSPAKPVTPVRSGNR